MFTVGMSVLQMELVATNSLITMVAGETVGVVRLRQGIYTLLKGQGHTRLNGTWTRQYEESSIMICDETIMVTYSSYLG